MRKRYISIIFLVLIYAVGLNSCASNQIRTVVFNSPGNECYYMKVENVGKYSTKVWVIGEGLMKETDDPEIYLPGDSATYDGYIKEVVAISSPEDIGKTVVVAQKIKPDE